MEKEREPTRLQRVPLFTLLTVPDKVFAHLLKMRIRSVADANSAFPPSFVVNSVVRQGCVLAQPFSNTCMDCLLVKVADMSLYGVSVGDIKVDDFVIGNDAVLLAESLHEERKTLGLKVS